MRNGRCRMHGGRSTGPKTSAGLKRSRKARWKTGKYSSECKTRRKVGLADLRWCARVIRMMDWVDKMYELLEEIWHQIDYGGSEGLQAKCQVALVMLREYNAVKRDMDTLGGSRPGRVKKLSRLDRTADLTLEAGAAGRGLDYMREIIRAHWELEDAIAKRRVVHINRHTRSASDKAVPLLADCA